MTEQKEKIIKVECIVAATCFFGNSRRYKGDFVTFEGPESGLPAHLIPVTDKKAVEQVTGKEKKKEEKVKTGKEADGLSQVDRETLVRKSVMTLDPEDDSHWTTTGQPAMKAVEAAFGDTSVSRDEVKTACPGFDGCGTIPGPVAGLSGSTQPSGDSSRHRWSPSPGLERLRPSHQA